jgi:uncharacterized protein
VPFKSAPPVIETPCTRVCTLDPASGLCLGCGRSLAEIARWTQMSDAERARLMAELPRRRQNRQPAAAGVRPFVSANPPRNMP